MGAFAYPGTHARVHRARVACEAHVKGIYHCLRVSSVRRGDRASLQCSLQCSASRTCIVSRAGTYALDLWLLDAHALSLQTKPRTSMRVMALFMAPLRST
eukprot:6203450-Pleurochrysis_carterae.AAC.1